MQRIPRLSIDGMSEVADIMRKWADEVFYDFSAVEPRQGTVYVIGRQQWLDNREKIMGMCQSDQYVMIFNNSAEGSWTIETQLAQLKIEQLVTQGRVLVISGAAISPQHASLTHEHLLTKIMDFELTRESQTWTDDIFAKRCKPYQFLFLNGRARPHRKYLYEHLRRRGLLEHSLYTMLDDRPTVVRQFNFREDGIDVMATPSELRRLPDEYEVERYRSPEFGPQPVGRTNLKQELFRQEWGDIYLYHRPYVDTYFSLVTETVCSESAISFRTEKIAKPLAMGHPFVVAATSGFYRDLKNLGFRTFGSTIDESFDQIEHAQTRLDRLLQVVQDLCKQDLAGFLDAVQDVCKYNQQYLAEFTRQHRLEFPARFFQFISQHARS